MNALPMRLQCVGTCTSSKEQSCVSAEPRWGVLHLRRVTLARCRRSEDWQHRSGLCRRLDRRAELCDRKDRPLRHRESFVPLQDATVTGSDIRVAYNKTEVKDAPRVDPDERITPTEEQRLYAHYGISSPRGHTSGTERTGPSGHR